MRSPPLMILSVTLSGCALLGRGPTPAAPADPEAPQASEDAPGRTRPRPYRRVITEEAVTRRGLFDVHRVGDALYFEVPPSALGREMLLLARTAESTAQSQRAMIGGERSLIVQWERMGGRVVLREKEYDVHTDTTLSIWRHVEGMRRGPVLAVLPVRAYGADSAAVVDQFCQVHGVEGLKVIDASVMPEIPRANTNATTIMIAERASDFVVG